MFQLMITRSSKGEYEVAPIGDISETEARQEAHDQGVTFVELIALDGGTPDQSLGAIWGLSLIGSSLTDSPYSAFVRLLTAVYESGRVQK